MVEPDEYQIRKFWKTFTDEANSLLDWIININRKWPKDTGEILGILERLIYTFSIHSDFNFNNRQDGLIKTSLLKSFKDPLKFKTKGEELIHSVFSDLNG